MWSFSLWSLYGSFYSLFCFCWFLFLSFFLFVSEYLWLLTGHSLWMGTLTLPQRGSSVLPSAPGQCQLDPSGHIQFFRAHKCPDSVTLSSCSVAVMSQGVVLSSFLSPFPLAQFSTKASFFTVLCAYEDGGLVDRLLRTEPLKVLPAPWVVLLWPPCLNQAQLWFLFSLHPCGPGTLEQKSEL